MLLEETLETIATESATIQNLFGGDGRPVANRRRSAQYLKQLEAAARLMIQVEKGRRPMHHLKEAMTTSDFPILFADILDRQLLANYQEIQPVYQAFVRESTVPNFNEVKRFAVDGAESALPEVDEREEYPEGALIESEDTLSVRKYGRRLDLSWEAMVNDDLDAFRRNPDRLARAARRSEQRFVTSLYVDANGPHASLYTVGNGNIVTGNPPLTLAGLQTAYTTLAAQRDEDDEPIVIDMATLVVPPALEVTANNILNALQIEMTDQGGSASQKLIAKNWMAGRLRVVVDPYIPVIASTANGNTMWALFANPNTGRAALEFAKLRGHEDPALYERAPNARRIGGGDVMESFEDDSVAWRVRHVFGGTRLTSTGGAKSTVASQGDGT